MRNSIKSTGIAFLITILPFIVQAQNEVTGKVTGTGGIPVEGASVVVSGTGKGTLTDKSGMYTVNLDNGTYTITVSSIGFYTKSKSVTVSGNTVVDFEMEGS